MRVIPSFWSRARIRTTATFTGQGSCQVRNRLGPKRCVPADRPTVLSPAHLYIFVSEGWLTWEECCILYHLARKTNGPIYEQGSFRGRSTCCIAQGVKDSKVKKTFITSDIFPIGAKSFATGKFPYNSIPYRWQYRPGKQKKPLVDFMVDGTRAGSSTVEEYSKMLDKIYEQPGGLLAELVGGVARAGLSDYVYIIAGKTVPDLDYQLVWTDSAHGLREIAANMNNWQRFLREDRPTVFAFHDVALDNESMRYVRTQMNVTYEFSMKTIFVIEAWKNKNWVPIDLKKLRQGGRWTRPKRPLRKSDNRQ
ncbi:hypothetical protein DFJ74DRAFT_685379 [Hyaloraphidium curvatum]|nr:hypothetical protein DFJ74DRAFT_685379 [Hyaloraphidium curvatum]